MLLPLTERQKKLIINNVVKACNDITKLNGTGYNFLYLASGFIARYNLAGFIDYYTRHDLLSDILYNFQANRWMNFHPGEENYEYYMAKRDVYERIIIELGGIAAVSSTLTKMNLR